MYEVAAFEKSDFVLECYSVNKYLPNNIFEKERVIIMTAQIPAFGYFNIFTMWKGCRIEQHPLLRCTVCWKKGCSYRLLKWKGT